MDIKQIKYFLEICKYGSISRAANTLFISQQGLSSSIRRLEDELKCDLFYRKGNSLVLTEQGKYFMEQATDIAESFDRLQNHFLFSGGSANRISVICVYSIISKCPPTLQHLLMSRDSGMEITLGECYSDQCAQYLESDACAFVVGYDLDEWKDRFEIDPLFQVEHCFIVHRSHPLAQAESIDIEQLHGVRMILPTQQTAIRMKMNRLLAQRRVRPVEVFQTNQSLQIYNLLANDHSLVARITLGDAQTFNNPDFRTLRVRNVDLFTRAVLVRRRDRPLSTVERLFRQEVLSAARA